MPESQGGTAPSAARLGGWDAVVPPVSPGASSVSEPLVSTRPSCNPGSVRPLFRQNSTSTADAGFAEWNHHQLMACIVHVQVWFQLQYAVTGAVTWRHEGLGLQTLSKTSTMSHNPLTMLLRLQSLGVVSNSNKIGIDTKIFRLYRERLVSVAWCNRSPWASARRVGLRGLFLACPHTSNVPRGSMHRGGLPVLVKPG
ncbi:hypothetical protein BD289DRAFT_431735 [Coniella lustricola]|uniref:Uncharacterized protein n=1 Tax=Coniella lustricola TaxID=2025994 RepID=A0A2T3AAG8_9PEZI|nr:hypothetical protein BD289DRAFT_431735 [Coniella lustricola]